MQVKRICCDWLRFDSLGTFLVLCLDIGHGLQVVETPPSLCTSAVAPLAGGIQYGFNML